MQPDTRYAKSGDVHIAYQVFGEGPLNVVFELSIPDKQALLATLDPVRRLERVGDLLQGNA
jgi:hypothetical protein